VQPIIDPESWAMGCRSAANPHPGDARQLADSLAESDKYDSFWDGRLNAQEALREQRWATLGMLAGRYGLSEDSAGTILTSLGAATDMRETFWAGWRCETCLADPEWIAEMKRLLLR
jgi:hypothetical protein